MMGDLIHLPALHDSTPARDLHPSRALPEITPAVVAEGIANFRALLLRAHDNLTDHADDAGVLAQLVLGLQALTKDVQAWTADAKRLLVPLVKAEGERGVLDLTAEAGAVVTAKGGTKRTQWDSDRLFSLIVQRALEAVHESGKTVRVLEPDSGELVDALDPDAVAVAVAFHLHECLPVTPSIGWRVTALRDRGVDPSGFCHEERTEPTVIVTGSEG